ncbi:hypothetical protein SUNI508_10893 [Seiridium unicorne]|uniref:Uncharacterized protein n=1 Tax=Seiridium unicorne TaxID=138068 RepID=A0ABR2UJH8_9PEZI
MIIVIGRAELRGPRLANLDRGPALAQRGRQFNAFANGQWHVVAEQISFHRHAKTEHGQERFNNLFQAFGQRLRESDSAKPHLGVSAERLSAGRLPRLTVAMWKKRDDLLGIPFPEAIVVGTTDEATEKLRSVAQSYLAYRASP